MSTLGITTHPGSRDPRTFKPIINHTLDLVQRSFIVLLSAKSSDQTEDVSAVSSHDDVERHCRNGFERSGGARLLAGFDVRNITLPETGLLGDVDLRAARYLRIARIGCSPLSIAVQR
jgi:hypothetical protein